MREVKLAVLGAGTIAGVHARSLQRVRNAKVVAVVDIIRQRAESLAEKLNASRVYEDIDAALADGGFDAVDICLPTYLHSPVAVAAAAKGYHVLCEKPMALTLEQAEAMLAAARRAGVVLMIAHCRRFDHYWLAFRQAVLDGVIGRPVVWRSLSAGPGPGIEWFLDRTQGGGPLIDGAIHNYDFARAIFGEALSAYTAGHHFNPDYSAFDTGTTIVKFESGDTLELSWSWAMPRGVSSRFEDILGPQGVLYLSPPRHAPNPPQADAQTGYLALQRPGGQWEYMPYAKNDMYEAEIQAFVDAVLAGQPSPLDPADTLRSLAIASAVLESAATGQLVEIQKYRDLLSKFSA